MRFLGPRTQQTRHPGSRQFYGTIKYRSLGIRWRYLCQAVDDDDRVLVDIIYIFSGRDRLSNVSFMIGVDVPGVELYLDCEHRLALGTKIYLIKDDSHCALACDVNKSFQILSPDGGRLVVTCV
jgi:hypothetical protein